MRNIINIDTFFKDPNQRRLELEQQKKNEEEVEYLMLKDKLKAEAA